MSNKWTADSIPDQTGRVAIITGANIGLGYESALALARKGAQVIIASRDRTKGQAAVDSIKQQIATAGVEFIQLDLANLASIQSFVAEFKTRYDQLDLLLNNAGVMAIPRRETVDGFEMQLGTNHLGHFALTGQLLDLLLKTPNSRVVTTSSGAHMYGRFHFDDPQMRQKYGRWQAYGQSKFSNVLFAFELQRRLKAAGSETLSLVAHPGYARTNLQTTSTNLNGNWMERVMYPIIEPLASQSAAMGALPQLYAATAATVKGGEFYGPRFFIKGYPVLTKAIAKAYDETTAHRLWNLSEELTRVQFAFSKLPVTAEKK